MAQTEQDRPRAGAGDWHAFDPGEVTELLGVEERGLSSSEAAERLERSGPNELEGEEPPSSAEILLDQFRSPLIAILLVAAVVTAALGEYVDMGVIAAVLVLNAAIGFVQERRAERSIQALMQLAAPSALVVRDGEEVEVVARELVPGDLVILRAGDRVPADVRLLATTGLDVDESLLTGESTSVSKQTEPVEADAVVAERTCMAFMGSNVAGGRGRGVVVATGMDTELGSIAEQVHGEEEPETPLQQRMRRFANLIGVAVVLSAALAAAVGFVLGFSLDEVVLVAVALAVSAVPEGLPVAFTVALALGVRRMAAREAVIRRLPAVETLGSTTVIGSDKTGTLTANEMTVEEVWAAGRRVDLREDGEPELDEPLRLTLLAGVLTNQASWKTDGDDDRVEGDATEVALLRSAARCGVDPARARADHQVDADRPFEATRKFSATACTDAEGRHLLFVKGAPETVLEMSDDQLTADGPTGLDADAVHAEMERMADDGLRVLAMGYTTLEEPPSRDAELEPSRLTFLGLQGMMDPPREGVADAIAGCREAGIRVVMITGDHARTARAIGAELGMAADDDAVLTGAEIEGMDDAALRDLVTEVAIYARVSPEHKLRIVHALQEHGHVAAVTGDGVNDAPALKAAEIGIAMGRSGTDVAKESADMVLTDDDFRSIYAAVEEGRVTFDNVRKVTFFLVATGAAEVLAIFTGLLTGLPLVLLPAQLLWLNLVTNGLQDVALAFEPGEKGALRRAPRKLSEGVLSRTLWERVAVVGVVMAALTVGLFAWTYGENGDLTQARSAALTALVVFTAVQVLNSRAEHASVFSMNPVANRFLTVAQIGALGVHAVALHLPFTQFVLRVEPIPLAAWGRIVLLSLAVVVANELHKLARR
ncbi:MAG TPA: HAD-IC family P-type ATPase [Egibacteraceae bacterium]|nr:HAD-IC family P-type ATPase [Egibacteraceae bacterium]